MSGPTDFNDLHAISGLTAVRAQLLAATRPPDPEPEPVPAVAEPPAEPWTTLLQTKKGIPLPCIGNVRTVLQHDPRWQGVLGYCEFSYRIIKRKPPPFGHASPGEWTDGDTARLRIWLSDQYRFTPSIGDALDGALVTAERSGYHPVREYLAPLRWDGTERLVHWLQDFAGAKGPPEYLASVGKKCLVAAVARVMKPGCKVDNVPILEGEQGSGKSSLVHCLFGEWFSDAPMKIHDKDAYQNLTGVWCLELAELDSFNKAESTEAKSFFSQRRDRYRPSYGRVAQDFPRQCVFFGTTNQDSYLKDQTGNRRYWPIRTTKINLDAVRAVRDQLWAEARHCYDAGHAWWTEPDEVALFRAQQEWREIEDPWEEMIREHLNATTSEFVSTNELLVDVIKKPRDHITKADQMRIVPLLKRLGWIKTRKGNDRARGYRRGFRGKPPA